MLLIDVVVVVCIIVIVFAAASELMMMMMAGRSSTRALFHIKGVLEFLLDHSYHFGVAEAEEHRHAETLEGGTNGGNNLVDDLPLALGLRPEGRQNVMKAQQGD